STALDHSGHPHRTPSRSLATSSGLSIGTLDTYGAIIVYHRCSFACPAPSTTTAKYPRCSLEYMANASPSWRTLDRHLVVLAARRTFDRLGSRMEMRTAMMPMTTSSSTSVNAGVDAGRWT